MTEHSAVWGGFTDQRLDDTHARVTFQGNSMTSRERVENYLLYRAAELTVAQGYDWFEMVDSHTGDHQSTYVEPGPAYGGFYGGGYWRPSWRFHGGFGWRGWDPYWGGPFWADNFDVETVDRYEANAEIAMGHGPKPADDRKVFDARAVMANLGPSIVKPS